MQVGNVCLAWEEGAPMFVMTYGEVIHPTIAIGVKGIFYLSSITVDIVLWVCEENPSFIWGENLCFLKCMIKINIFDR